MIKLTTLAMVALMASTLSACDFSPTKIVGGAQDKLKDSITSPATQEEKDNLAKRTGKITQVPSKPVVCSDDPALILCVSYPTSAALLSDPNVQKFGFAITLDEKQIKPGFPPALKYKTNKDGSVSRG